jgi:endoribonuclease Nob1
LSASFSLLPLIEVEGINPPFGSLKVAAADPPSRLLFVLDASAVVHGVNVPPGSCLVAARVTDEFSPGGATRRRLDLLLAGGLRVEDAPPAARRRVDETARTAGSLGRLSEADRDSLALALAAGATLVTDDYTLQDVARRLGVAVLGVGAPGAQGTIDWTARCAGCGRTYDASWAGRACRVCGAEVRRKPKRR